MIPFSCKLSISLPSSHSMHSSHVGDPLGFAQSYARAKCHRKEKQKGFLGRQSGKKKSSFLSSPCPPTGCCSHFVCAKTGGEAGEGADFSLGEKLQGRIWLLYLLVHVRDGRKRESNRNRKLYIDWNSLFIRISLHSPFPAGLLSALTFLCKNS